LEDVSDGIEYEDSPMPRLLWQVVESIFGEYDSSCKESDDTRKSKKLSEKINHIPC